jgi:hypothetical protein
MNRHLLQMSFISDPRRSLEREEGRIDGTLAVERNNVVSDGDLGTTAERVDHTANSANRSANHSGRIQADPGGRRR